MNDYRKTVIVDNLAQLIIDNTDFTVANLLVSALRNKNNSGTSPEPYNMSDEDLNSALEKMITELKEEV